ncbi:hypothetical protein OQJ13_16415 [Legionella sp. PATHC035]|uniref:hypothetical protein n=1 Tax=Legionella sp. PATHC035 TaxID=2992040 RepID=UPI002244C07E|nr:hypothetical protein [Legionella sp. PATHC035]MCW8410564.1 hypothetical protein [Legionella sp. PATHC035]
MKYKKEINPSIEQLFEQSNTKKIEEILETHKRLLQIKEALNDIIDSMISKPSLLSQAARYWNEVPLWQKISFGILLVAPAFFIGIFVHVAVLTTLSLVALFAYTASSYLLGDHFADHSANLDKLKQGIAGLGTLLSSMVELLDLLNKQFAEQIQKFKDNNSLLSSQIESLDNQVDELNQQIEKFKATQQKLHQIQIELEKESMQLKMENQEQSKLIHTSQIQLEEVTSEYQQNQIKLSTQIVDLTESKTKIEQELERLRKCIVIFQKTTEQLTSTLSMNQEQQTAFVQRINEFITDKENRLEYVIGTISHSADALSQTKDEYKISIERHKQLVDQYELLVKRYEAIVAQMEQKTESPKQKKDTAKALTQFGLYSVDGIGSPIHPQQDHQIYPVIKIK